MTKSFSWVVRELSKHAQVSSTRVSYTIYHADTLTTPSELWEQSFWLKKSIISADIIIIKIRGSRSPRSQNREKSPKIPKIIKNQNFRFHFKFVHTITKCNCVHQKHLEIIFFISMGSETGVRWQWNALPQFGPASKISTFFDCFFDCW